MDALLITEGGRTAFDLVTPHPTCIAVATAKFHDIARLEQPPVRIAIVHRKARLGDLLSVVAQAASVIEDDAPDRTLKRAIAA